MTRGIRYFCVTPVGNGLPLLGLEYLKGFIATGKEVCARPIGFAQMAVPPWTDYLRYFSAPQPQGRYVNVVCAPVGYPMGAPFSDLVDGKIETVYRPQGALTGCLTVGVPNVAVTRPPASVDETGEAELQALQNYDVIVCPTPQDVLGFRALGLDASFILPEPMFLADLVDSLL